jgi:AcrR family transcriptional regulator
MSKRDLILTAALKLFVENGFHGTATSKIAQEAGVANGTLFQYFKTKDELVVALYLHVKEELTAYVARHTTADAGIKEAIQTQVLSTLYWALEQPLKFRFIQQLHSSPYIELIDQDLLHKQMEPHLTLIQKGVKQGVLKPLPAELLYALMSNQVFGLYQFITAKKMSKPKQKQAIQATFNMLWDMVT